MNGSMFAVAGSGISSMSDAWMPFQPAIDEPSNAWPRLELVVVERLGRHRDVLLLAAGVGEAEVDELDLLVLDHLEHVGWRWSCRVSWVTRAKADGASRIERDER